MTKHDHDKTDDRSAYQRQQDHDDAAARAEAARVASLTPSDTPADTPADGSAPVEPHTEMFPHQPHGQAGQPANRPAHEGHQGVTPIQPEDQGLTEGISPVEAITHGEPNRIVDTEYSRHKGENKKANKTDDSKANKRYERKS